MAHPLQVLVLVLVLVAVQVQVQRLLPAQIQGSVVVYTVKHSQVDALV
jgi:hypothetical protein